MGALEAWMRSPHEGMEHGDGMSKGIAGMSNATHGDFGPSYFTWPEHQSTLLLHIALMTIAWVLWLPIGVYKVLFWQRCKLKP